jgi:hypothetical protein
MKNLMPLDETKRFLDSTLPWTWLVVFAGCVQGLTEKVPIVISTDERQLILGRIAA